MQNQLSPVAARGLSPDAAPELSSVAAPELSPVAAPELSPVALGLSMRTPSTPLPGDNLTNAQHLVAGA